MTYELNVTPILGGLRGLTTTSHRQLSQRWPIPTSGIQGATPTREILAMTCVATTTRASEPRMHSGSTLCTTRGLESRSIRLNALTGSGHLPQ
jgi:hypothetical protein